MRERVQKWQAERETWQAHCILTTIKRSNHSISHYSIPPKVTSITNSGSFETSSPVVLQPVGKNQSWIGSEDTKSFWRWTSQLKKVTHYVYIYIWQAGRGREGKVRDILAKKPVLPTDSGKRTVQQHWWLDQTRSEAKMKLNVIKAYLLSQRIKIKLVYWLKNLCRIFETDRDENF